MTFTFIAPRGFTHPKTCAHVRLLGPCFKTGRMDPYDRQHPKGMVRDHRPNDRQRSPSTASSPPHSTAGRKEGTLATGGIPATPRSGPVAWSPTKQLFVIVERFDSHGQQPCKLLYEDKQKYLHKKRVQLSKDCFGTPTWRPFHFLGQWKG